MIRSLYDAIAWSAIAGVIVTFVSVPFVFGFIMGHSGQLPTPDDPTWNSRASADALQRAALSITAIVGPLLLALWLVGRVSHRRYLGAELGLMVAIPASFWLVLGPRLGFDALLLLVAILALSTAFLAVRWGISRWQRRRDHK